MSIGNSPGIVTNGLVFHMDMNNIKSYAGPPITNLLPQIATSSVSDNGSTYRVFSGTENVYIPTLGYVNNCAYVDTFNNYSSSGNCCPNFFSYGSASVSPSTQYTYAIVFNCFTGYNNPNYMYHYEYNGGTYVGEYGLYYPAGNAYGGQNVVLGNSNWNWGSSVYTTSSTTNTQYNYLFYYQYNTWDRIYVANVLLTPGDYRNMHPRYWPAVGTSRSTSQTHFDLTGNSSITPNSLTYNSDGTFSFNGSSNYITVGASSNWAFGLSGTIEQWVYVSGNSGTNNRFWCTNNNSSSLDAYLNGSSYNIYFHGGAVGTTSAIPTGQWVHLAVTYTGGTIAVYFNGVSQGLTGTTTGYNITNNGTLYIGQYQGGGNYYFNGNISNMKVYSRSLSTLEIQQNFNAHRGRFGI